VPRTVRLVRLIYSAELLRCWMLAHWWLYHQGLYHLLDCKSSATLVRLLKR
jgi:hypothetical protein